jgi:hypothetical protein
MAEVQYLPDTTKMRAKDRELVLKVIDGKAPKSSTGMVDSRLFTGDNKMWAKMDPQSCFWSLHYDVGNIPQALRMNFTSFSALKKYAENYFKGRNIEIKEVVD